MPRPCPFHRVATAKRKGPRYTPISRRNERPAAIKWLLRNHPELKDAQIMRLVGTTKSTIDSVREGTHWNSANITAADPVTRTFLVKADVGRAAVKLGQTASITLDLPKTNGVNKLPLSALMEYEGKTAVWLLDKESMTVRPQVVQVAGAEANSAVISSGV